MQLADGTTVSADMVLSGADPKHTFETLCDPADLPADFLRAVRNIRSDGTSIKINLALDRLPATVGPDGDGSAAVPLRRLRDRPDARRPGPAAGRGARRHPATGAHIEMCFPTVHDPSLAPEGKHVATIDVMSQPYTLAGDGWDSIKEKVADRVLDELDGYFPGLSSSVLHRQVLSPLDLERILGLTGGHALHGEMAPDQLFMNRPVRGHADYRTPDRRPLPVRGRDPPGWRGQRRQRTQLRHRGAARPAPRPGWLRRLPTGSSNEQER